MPPDLLSPEEFALLSPAEQDLYLAALAEQANEWRLQPHQQRAEDLSHKVDEILFGGSAGPGKSEWLLYHAHHLSRRFPRHRCLVLRKSFPELRRSLIQRSFLRFNDGKGKTKKDPYWRASDKEWRYENGSVIEFGHCETEDDVRIYLSAEYDAILIDEATDFTQEQFEMLRSRCRTTVEKRAMGVHPHVACASNPGGDGHVFFKDRFVDGTNHGDYVAEMLDDPDDPASIRLVAFVPAFVDDNAYMDPMYKRSLNAMSDPVKRAQYRDGDWDVFTGRYFTEWSRDLHVIEPFRIPADWPRIAGHDHGWDAPTAHLWCAFDPDGRGYVYREFYERGLTPVQQAERIVKSSVRFDDAGIVGPEPVDYRVADPSIWNNTGAGPPIAMQLMEAGLVGLRRANNARVDGWQRLREYLRPDAMLACDHHRAEGLDRCPAVHVFNTCENLCRTMPLMVHDTNRPEDLDTTKEDHAPDALRYLLMSRPRQHRETRKEPVTLEEKIAADLHRRRNQVHRRRHDILGKV